MKKKQKKMTHTFRNLIGNWADTDYKILHACFDFFCDYVEKEKGLEVLKYQWTYWKTLPAQDRKDMGMLVKDVKERTKEAHNVYYEAEDLYNWWKNTFLPQERRGYWNEMKPEFYNIENYQLTRLIKIRKYLWT